MTRTIKNSSAGYRFGSLRTCSSGCFKQLTRSTEQQRGVAWLLASCLLGFASSGAFAAVPVEDMSTRDVRPQVTAPQPILPGSLQPGEQPAQGGQAAPAGAVPATTLGTPQPVTTRSGASPATAAGRSTGQNAQLFYELQALQTELQQLRGLVEDQAYEIARLRDLQRSQYLDIDRRLTDSGRSGSPGGLAGSGSARSATGATAAHSSGAGSGSGIGSGEPVRTAPNVVVQTGNGASLGQPDEVVTATDSVSGPATSSAQVVPAATAPAQAAPSEPISEPMTEQSSYTYAFELMKDQQFEQSIGAHQTVVDNWPDGKYAPESRYWLGELYLMSDRLEDARGSFNQVVEVFPAHQKVPLSLYKLGVVNHRLGVTPKALEYLDDVVVRYPDTPAAGLARTYAAELR